MQKIPTLFVRDPKNLKLVTSEVDPACAWVLAGEGVATAKFDGTACAVFGGRLYKRCEWPEGKGTAPGSWRHWDGDPNRKHGHGWIPVSDDPQDQHHREAWDRSFGLDADGNPITEGMTYELCGPKVQGNPHGYRHHVLVLHGSKVVIIENRSFASLPETLRLLPFEGLVFYHPDGRRAKIKRRDFGIEWPSKGMSPVEKNKA